MAFENLNVRVSANTQDFERGISGAKRELSGLNTDALQTAAALQVLQGRADEAGDEIEQTGDNASRTSASFAALTASTEGLGLSFGTLSTITTLSLIPAIAALSTTLLPLAATFGTVAAAAGGLVGVFGAIVGSGLIAFGQQRGEQNKERLIETRQRIAELESLRETQGELTDAQKEELEQLEERSDKLEEQTGIMGGLQSAMADLREELTPIIVEFGQQFVPLIEDAIDAIPDLVENIFEALGGVDEFSDALRDFGEEAFEAIPQIVAAFANLARDALPVLIDLVGWLGDNAGRIFSRMVSITRRLAPLFMDLINAIIDATPQLTRFGTLLLSSIIPAISDFVGLIGDLVQWWNQLDGTIKTAIFITLGSALAAVSTGLTGIIAALTTAVVIWDNLQQAFSDIISIITGGLSSAFETLEDILDSVVNVITGLPDDIETAINNAVDWLRNKGHKIWSSGVELLTSVLSGALDIVGILQDSFDAVINFLTGEGENKLRKAIGNAADAISNSLATALGAAGGFLVDAFESVAQWLSEKSWQAFDWLVELSNLVADAVVAGITGIIPDIGPPTGGGAGAAPGAGVTSPPQRDNIPVEGQSQTNQSILVRLEGDTEIIRNVSTEVIEERERRAKRQTGGAIQL